MRRHRRIHLVQNVAQVDTLDTWPGDEVWYSDFRYLGSINEDGNLVIRFS